MSIYKQYRDKVSCSVTDSEYSSCMITDSIKKDFFSHPNLAKAYRNFDYTKEYDILVAEKQNYRNPIEEKLLISYPYDTPQFRLGDYVSFYDATNTLQHWLIENLNTQEIYDVSGRIAKTTDKLRFYDKNGIYHNIPCVIHKGSFYDLKKDTYVNIPDNQLRVLVRYTDESKLIEWADIDSTDSKYTRFILQEYAYRTVSIDRHTHTQNGIGYMDIRLQADMKKSSDDLINNIADANQVITVDIQNGATLTIGEGQSVQLNTAVTLNGEELVNPVVNYTTSNEAIATVNSTGLVSGVSSGSVNIGATYSTASDSIAITVEALASDNYTVDITASNNIIDIMRLGEQVAYTATSLNNGVAYSTSGAWSLLADDGVTPLNSSIVSIVSTIGNVIKLKCSSNSAYKGTYFRLKYTDVNASNELRMNIKGLW